MHLWSFDIDDKHVVFGHSRLTGQYNITVDSITVAATAKQAYDSGIMLSKQIGSRHFTVKVTSRWLFWVRGGFSYRFYLDDVEMDKKAIYCTRAGNKPEFVKNLGRKFLMNQYVYDVGTHKIVFQHSPWTSLYKVKVDGDEKYRLHTRPAIHSRTSTTLFLGFLQINHVWYFPI